MNSKIIWAAVVLAGLATGAGAQEAPTFGLRLPPPSAPPLTAPYAPTSRPHVFVREAPGTRAPLGGARLIYRVSDDAPLPPAPTYQSVQRFSGRGAGASRTADGRLFAYFDPSNAPRASVILTPPYAAAVEAWQAKASATPAAEKGQTIR